MYAKPFISLTRLKYVHKNIHIVVIYFVNSLHSHHKVGKHILLKKLSECAHDNKNYFINF